jgi:hypothetical protein
MLKVFHPPIPDDYQLLNFILHSPAYQYTGMEECDLILFPQILWGEEKGALNKKLSHIEKNYPPSKPILVFAVADHEGKLKLPARIILLRTSLKRSIQNPRELPLPYIWDNYMRPFKSLEEGLGPRVGFCGLVSKPRRKIIKCFQKSEAIHTDFICRGKFWGGNPHDEKLVREFDENMESNMYILAPRGKGNFSMRFYQALSAGRIPVLTDTDIVLPFADQIPWKEIIIFEKNEKQCLEKVLETFQDGNVVALQNQCRDIYERYFSPDNYFHELVSVLKAKYLDNPGPWMT